MHIKQVVVEGFKTYREQTAVDFQPHLNCIGAPASSGATTQTFYSRHRSSTGNAPAALKMFFVFFRSLL